MGLKDRIAGVAGKIAQTLSGNQGISADEMKKENQEAQGETLERLERLVQAAAALGTRLKNEELSEICKKWLEAKAKLGGISAPKASLKDGYATLQDGLGRLREQLERYSRENMTDGELRLLKETAQTLGNLAFSLEGCNEASMDSVRKNECLFGQYATRLLSLARRYEYTLSMRECRANKEKLGKEIEYLESQIAAMGEAVDDSELLIACNKLKGKKEALQKLTDYMAVVSAWENNEASFLQNIDQEIIQAKNLSISRDTNERISNIRKNMAALVRASDEVSLQYMQQQNDITEVIQGHTENMLEALNLTPAQQQETLEQYRKEFGIGKSAVVPDPPKVSAIEKAETAAPQETVEPEPIE